MTPSFHCLVRSDPSASLVEELEASGLVLAIVKSDIGFNGLVFPAGEYEVPLLLVEKFPHAIELP